MKKIPLVMWIYWIIFGPATGIFFANMLLDFIPMHPFISLLISLCSAVLFATDILAYDSLKKHRAEMAERQTPQT